jgi:hypothetical protein
MTAYVLVHNGFVINGPRAWNYRSFESSLQEDCEIEYKLPMSKTDEEIIEIDENTKIYAAELVYPNYNAKIEYPHGPFWDFSTGKAIGTFQVLPTPIELIKNTLKAKVAEIRWRKEIAGLITNVQDNDVFVDTAREVRDVFLQKYILMNENETVQWKFNSGWVTLTRTEVNTIATAVANHIQSQFDWEIAKHAEIDACSTAEELDAIVLEE